MFRVTLFQHNILSTSTDREAVLLFTAECLYPEKNFKTKRRLRALFFLTHASMISKHYVLVALKRKTVICQSMGTGIFITLSQSLHFASKVPHVDSASNGYKYDENFYR